MKIQACRPAGNGSYILECTGKKANTELFLASPLEMQTQILDLPRIENAHIGGTVRIMLRSLHPGNPESVLSDFLVSVTGAQDYAAYGGPLPVFTSLRETIDAFRDAGKPIIPGIALLAPTARLDNLADDIGILSCPEWSELVRFKDGKPVSATAVKGLSAKSAERTIRKLFDLPSLESTGIFTILIGDLPAVTRGDVPTCKNFRSAGIETLSGERGPARVKDIEIFGLRKKKKTNTFAALTAALVLLNLACMFLSLESRIGGREERCQSLKKEYGTRLREITEINRLTEELKAVNDKAPGVASDPEPYLVLSALTEKSRRMHVRSVNIQGRSFQLTAVGRDSLQILSTVSASPFFRNVSLRQSTPLDGGDELFTISGETADDSQ